VIDCNRDPSGRSLYPGEATTELCPTTTFDGQALYEPGLEPDAHEIEARRVAWFDPYHAAVAAELGRLKDVHGAVVLYDAHSIRSRIPRLFDGLLPNFNIGTNSGLSCDPVLTRAVETACAAEPFTQVTDGRFKGGHTTRRYGRPEHGVHAIQMELACRGYMDEPDGDPSLLRWPPAYDADRAAPMAAVLLHVLQSCCEAAARLAPSRKSA
jgi:formiminoglutamase